MANNKATLEKALKTLDRLEKRALESDKPKQQKDKELSAIRKKRKRIKGQLQSMPTNEPKTSYRIAIKLKDGRARVLPKRFSSKGEAVKASKKYRGHDKVSQVKVVPNKGQ